MKQFFFLNIMITIVLLAGCRKIDVEPSEGTPVFSADFSFDGAEKEWQAGVDSFYMFAGYEKGADNVYVFTGELKMENCSTGCESLKIYIRDLQPLVQGNPDLAEALKLEFYEFAAPVMSDTIWQLAIDTTYAVTFDASASVLPNGIFSGQYSWIFSNSQADSGQLVTFPSVNLEVPRPMTLTVTANNSGCSSSQMQPVSKSNSPVSSEKCAVQIVYDSLDNELYAQADGLAPFTFLWNTGDSGQYIPVGFNSQNFYSVTVTSANGCVSNASVFYTNNPGTLPQICSAGFNYQTQPDGTTIDSSIVSISTGDTLKLGKVIIEYTNAAGVTFRSDWTKQNSAAFFEIQSVEDYEENELGKPTKKLKIVFSCQVASTNTVPGIKMIEGTAIFAVAHP